jgi:NAD(P)-dependent dehydrogenase (short-subunit alcohol dehydrogenase family)
MPYAPLELTGKVALITGGTTGIGRAIALAMSEAGADVVPTARRQPLVDEVATEIARRGRRTARVTCDVTDLNSLEAARDQVLAELGRVDILVNCAGTTKRVAAMEMEDADWRAILDTNLTGTFHACRVFGRPMLEQGWGRIVNIASLSSFVALFEVAAYTASKAGVVGLTKALAIEWGPRGVNVNAIAPGVFMTPLNQALLENTPRGHEYRMRTPLRRFGRVEELAGAAIFLSSEAASFVNGEVIVVDGGLLASGVNK